MHFIRTGVSNAGARSGALADSYELMTGVNAVPAIGRRPFDNELDAYGLTHTGKVRKNNEDHFLLCALQRRIEVYHTSLPDLAALSQGERVAILALVADGVGGSKAGEEASRIALEHIARYVSESLDCYYTTSADDDSNFVTDSPRAWANGHREVFGRTSIGSSLLSKSFPQRVCGHRLSGHWPVFGPLRDESRLPEEPARAR